MADHQFLRGKQIAISISDSADLSVLGLSESHLRDAAIEIARYLVAAGAHLIYGGDLRSTGYTELLAEVVARHHRASKGNEIAFTNYLPWPSYHGLDEEQLKERQLEFGRYACIVPLKRDGSDAPRDLEAVQSLDNLDREWAAGLTGMRRRITKQTSARIVLGGKITGYLGSMPGVAEETILSLESKKSTFILGGFGGCARCITMSIGLSDSALSDYAWECGPLFKEFSQKSLRNGLVHEENVRLAKTVHTDEIVMLILREMRRTLN